LPCKEIKANQNNKFSKRKRNPTQLKKRPKKKKNKKKQKKKNGKQVTVAQFENRK
jgi:hypothetical protein